jgi:hypothetical protein
MLRAGLIQSYNSRDDIRRTTGATADSVKIEALQWHFRNIGAPVFVSPPKNMRHLNFHAPEYTWNIHCPAWRYEAPTADPVKTLGSLYKEILEGAEIYLSDSNISAVESVK